MEALHDQSGGVYCWFDQGSGRIISLRGKNLAFVDGDSVYDWGGQHIGWWQDGHIRDRQGAVALFTADAGSLGVVKPVRAVRPVSPVKPVAPVRPVKQVKPVKTVKKLAWSSQMPF
jgi:hypothetical protein